MRRAASALLLAAAGCYVGPSRYHGGPPSAPPPAAPAPQKAPPPAAPPAPAARTPAPSPPPAAAAPSGGSPRMIVESEAVAAATAYARGKGFAVGRVKHVHLDGAGRWHVDIASERSSEIAKLLVDGWTGQVLKSTVTEEDE